MVIRLSIKQVTRRDQEVCVFHHSDFEGKELYTVIRWATVDEEGPDSQIFAEDGEEDNNETGKRKSRLVDEHKLVSAPPHAKKYLRGK